MSNTNEFVGCPICYEKWNSDERRPVIVGCSGGHTICKSCWKQIYHHATAYDDSRLNVNCPFCKDSVFCIKDKPYNIGLEQKIENEKDLLQEWMFTPLGDSNSELIEEQKKELKKLDDDICEKLQYMRQLKEDEYKIIQKAQQLARENFEKEKKKYDDRLEDLKKIHHAAIKRNKEHYAEQMHKMSDKFCKEIVELKDKHKIDIEELNKEIFQVNVEKQIQISELNNKYNSKIEELKTKVHELKKKITIHSTNIKQMAAFEDMRNKCFSLQKRIISDCQTIKRAIDNKSLVFRNKSGNGMFNDTIKRAMENCSELEKLVIPKKEITKFINHMDRASSSKVEVRIL